MRVIKHLMLIVVLLFSFTLVSCKDKKEDDINNPITNDINIVLDEGAITWDEVEGAKKYLLSINNVEYLTEDNFFDDVEEDGPLHVKVKALFSDDNVEDGKFSKTYTFNKLKKAKLQLIEDRVVWDEVSNATDYLVTYKGETVHVSTNEFEVQGDEDDFNLEVKAIGNEEFISSSSNIRRIETPLNVRVDKGYIKVDPVADASGYRLNINGEDYDYTDTTEFLVPKEVNKHNQELEIELQVLSNKPQLLSSNFQPLGSFSMLKAPELYFDGTDLRWYSESHVEVVEYHLYIDGAFKQNLGKVLNYPNISSLINDNKRHEIDLVAVADGETLSTQGANPITKLETATITSGDYTDNITWEPVKGATYYKVTYVPWEQYVPVDVNLLGMTNSRFLYKSQVVVHSIGDDNHISSDFNEENIIVRHKDDSIFYLGVIDEVNKRALLGHYPQGKVTNSNAISSLNGASPVTYRGHSALKYNDEYYKKHGSHYFKIDAIEWDIIKTSGNNYTLLAKSSLDSRRMRDYSASNQYMYSELRTFLNNDFYNLAFTDKEKNLINTTTVINSNASLHDPNGNSYGFSYTQPNSDDKVFLLSIREANRTYSSYKQANKTDYALAINNSASNYWWTRSPISYGTTTSTTHRQRSFYFIYSNAYNYTYGNNNYFGVRPVIETALITS